MSQSSSLHIKNIIGAVVLIAVGYFGRLFLLDYPNVETLTAVSLLAGILLGGVYAIVVPLAVVALTDTVIGNDIILVYTWSAWLLIGLSGFAARRFGKLHQARFMRFIFGTTGLGVASSLFFFLWTNFGVWQLFDYYPSGLNGLLASYVAGLPFLRLSLVGNLFIVPVVSATFIFSWRFLASPRGAAWMQSKISHAVRQAARFFPVFFIFGAVALSGCALTKQSKPDSEAGYDPNSYESPENIASDDTSAAASEEGVTEDPAPLSGLSEDLVDEDGALNVQFGYSVGVPDGWIVSEQRRGEVNVVKGGGPATFTSMQRADTSGASVSGSEASAEETPPSPSVSISTFNIDPALSASEVFALLDNGEEDCVVAGSAQEEKIDELPVYTVIMDSAVCPDGTESFYQKSVWVKKAGNGDTFSMDMTAGNKQEYERFSADFQKILDSLSTKTSTF